MLSNSKNFKLERTVNESLKYPIKIIKKNDINKDEFLIKDFKLDQYNLIDILFYKRQNTYFMILNDSNNQYKLLIHIKNNKLVNLSNKLVNLSNYSEKKLPNLYNIDEIKDLFDKINDEIINLNDNLIEYDKNNILLYNNLKLINKM